MVIDINHFDENLPIYRNGTVEELLGKYAIIRCATEIIKKQQYSESLLNSAEFIGNKEEIDVSDISKAANLGDKAALECFNLIGKYLGITIASLANIFDISNFIIGGGISQSDIIINAARKISKERSLPPVSARINVETARYLNDTGIIGAALLGKLEILK
ncbi:Glucokinase [bioreactor metagenome]|uniref:Glucokinase n=1 Tax=bioreactor metagenome TaxID=1076179 RepID=A0A645GQY5_9ZZZZ